MRHQLNKQRLTRKLAMLGDVLRFSRIPTLTSPHNDNRWMGFAGSGAL